MAKIDAVIIAGGTITNPDFRAEAGCDCRSLISIHGQPVVYWVAKALRESQSVGSVVVVGHDDLLDSQVAQIADQVLPEEGHEVADLMKGVRALPDAERILMVSGDTPLLTPTAMDDMVANSPDSDVVFAVVGKEQIMRDFPDRQWMFMRTREGEFTGSSSVIFRPEVFERHRETVIRIFNARQSVADLLKMLGLGFALRFAMGGLSIRDAEEHISKTLGINGRAYLSQFPELAFDVGRASDIALAEERLNGM